MGVWGVVIFVLSVMRAVGGVALWVVCVFRHVDVVCCVCCTQSCYSECCVHVCISCRYDWMFAFAMLMSLCGDVMVMLW